MNTSVDVLAVMDDAAKVLIDERMGATASLLEVARAEVAELIEAMENLFGADMEYCMEMDGKADQLEAVNFAKSALARVKGA